MRAASGTGSLLGGEDIVEAVACSAVSGGRVCWSLRDVAMNRRVQPELFVKGSAVVDHCASSCASRVVRPRRCVRASAPEVL